MEDVGWRCHGTAICASQHRMVVSLYAPALGADPNGGPSLCARTAQRTDAAPRACGSIRSSPHAELDDLPAAPLIRFTLQEATSASADDPTPQSRGETRPSRPSPGAVAPDSGARS